MGMSPEERRARDAERKRRARAAKAAERDTAKADARTSVASAAPSTMRDAVESALASAKWLTEADAASIAQARTLARRIDLLEHMDETTKALSAHRALSQILNDLGATASRRLQYELRSLRLHGTSKESDDEDRDEAAKPEGDVIEFRRPKGRRAR